jgi:hypothetical protein
MAIPPPPPPGDEPPMVPSTMEEPPQGPPPPEARALPWEETGYPFLEALFGTIKGFVVSPSQAFTRMKQTGDLRRPILYAVILGASGVVLSQLMFLATNLLRLPSLSRLEPGVAGMSLFVSLAIGLGFLLVSPLLTLYGVVLMSGVTHILLVIFGWDTRPLDATFRVTCYVTTAQLATIVPFCGSILLAPLWTLALLVTGISTAHEISVGKALVVCLLPVAICCFVLAIVFIPFGTAITAAIAGAASHAR